MRITEYGSCFVETDEEEARDDLRRKDRLVSFVVSEYRDEA